MLLMPQERKKAVTVIIEGMGGEGPPAMGDSDFAKERCCAMMLDCIERKNVKGLMECLKEMIGLCSHEDEPDEMMDY